MTKQELNNYQRVVEVFTTHQDKFYTDFEVGKILNLSRKAVNNRRLRMEYNGHGFFVRTVQKVTNTLQMEHKYNPDGKVLYVDEIKLPVRSQVFSEIQARAMSELVRELAEKLKKLNTHYFTLDELSVELGTTKGRAKTRMHCLARVYRDVVSLHCIKAKEIKYLLVEPGEEVSEERKKPKAVISHHRLDHIFK